MPPIGVRLFFHLFPLFYGTKVLASIIWIMGWRCGHGTRVVLPPRNQKVLALEDGRKTSRSHLLVLDDSHLGVRVYKT